MMFPQIDCNPMQRRILDASQHLLLAPEDQVNFHFMVHLRNVLKTPDFMESFEDELLQRKFDELRMRCPDFAELDYRQSFIPMPRYEPREITPERFQAMLNDPEVPPIVIKGLVKDARAVRTWTHEYLMNTYGKVAVVALEFAQDGSYQAVDSGAQNLSLADIIRVQLGKKKTENYYVNNSAQIFNDYPELVDEIGGGKVLELFRGHSVNTFSQLFVGNVRTWGTNWHQGNDLSCALMISGVKRWYFLDPRLVYILRSFLNGPNGMQTKAEVRHALEFQVLHNPLYAYAPKFVLDLEPGDALVFTKYWPHAVVNVSPFQIMANMRMTEVDLESLKKGSSTANLLPVFDNILDSDPEFIRFKFEIFQSLGKRAKEIGDNEYFSGYSMTRK
jgi:Cupin-like domain